MLTVSAAALVLSASAVSAQAADLVINGGFETGDFTGWTLVGSSDNSSVNNALVETGDFAGQFGEVGTLGGIAQDLATVAGQTYTFSFDLQNYGGNPTRAVVTFGGQTLVNLTNPAAFAYTHYSFDVTAASALTTIGFQFRNDPTYFHLDNVSVVGGQGSAVPEPATWAMLMLGMFGVGTTMRLRRRPAAA
jgi:hypothetical protein